MNYLRNAKIEISDQYTILFMERRVFNFQYVKFPFIGVQRDFYQNSHASFRILLSRCYFHCWWYEKSIDHFTVVCSVAWPLNNSEARDDLVLTRTSLLLFCKSSWPSANQVYNLHDKSREVCIKARWPPAALLFKAQFTEQTAVKWSNAY